MATYTPNLNLIKPEDTDFFDKQHQNDNMDILDSFAVIKGTTPPTSSTVGTVGQFYLDTETKILYQCVSTAPGIYGWDAIVKEPIGTVKSSLRTDLGGKWALCNGDGIDKDIYPELYELSKQKSIGVNMTYTLGSFPGNVSRVFMACGKYIYITNSGSSKNLVLYKSDKPTGPWTSLIVGTSSTTGFGEAYLQYDALTNVACIVVNEYNSGTNTDKNVVAFMCHDGTLSNWSKTTILSNVYNGSINSFSLQNGYFIVAFSKGQYGSNSNGCIYHIPSTGLGAWAGFTLSISGQQYSDAVSTIIYAGNKYNVIMRCLNSGSTTYLHVALSSLLQSVDAVKNTITPAQENNYPSMYKYIFLYSGKIFGVYSVSNNSASPRTGSITAFAVNVTSGAVTSKLLVSVSEPSNGSYQPIVLGAILYDSIFVVSYYLQKSSGTDYKSVHLYCIDPLGNNSDIWSVERRYEQTAYASALYYNPTDSNRTIVGMNSDIFVSTDIGKLSMRVPLIPGDSYSYIKIKE